jgi:hypothetical protein
VSPNPEPGTSPNLYLSKPSIKLTIVKAETAKRIQDFLIQTAKGDYCKLIENDNIVGFEQDSIYQSSETKSGLSNAIVQQMIINYLINNERDYQHYFENFTSSLQCIVSKPLKEID